MGSIGPRGSIGERETDGLGVDDFRSEWVYTILMRDYLI